MNLLNPEWPDHELVAQFITFINYYLFVASV
jgi:hypothetical protein